MPSKGMNNALSGGMQSSIVLFTPLEGMVSRGVISVLLQVNYGGFTA